MTVLVEIDAKSGQRKGDWVVRNGPGGAILSRHRTKRRAVSKARAAARERETDIRIQNTNGQWSQGVSYR